MLRPAAGDAIERIGYGAGQRDLPEHANVLRLLWARRHGRRAATRSGSLETNLDNVSGELVGYCIDAAVAGRGPGRLHHADPDEEEPGRA